MFGTLLLTLVTSQISASAAVNEVYETVNDDVRMIYVVYDESERCFLDTFQIKGVGLQERLSQLRFEDCDLAREIVKEKGAKRRDAKSGSADFVTETEDAIWVATDVWSDEWEAKYSEWVQNEVNYHFHFDHGVATDCADGAISTRWIFARIHHLPMGSTLAGSGALFTNESMRRAWKDLPTHENWWEDQRFMAALNYLMDNCYTHSLIVDSYPISIEPGVFAPGAHHLNLYSERTGHTQLVVAVNGAFGIKLIYSSVPRAVREFWTAIFSEPQYNGPERGGFLKMRWAEKRDGVWRLRPGEEMPHYSLMQYQRGFMRGYGSFSEAVLGHMGITLDPGSYLEEKINEFDSAISTRIKVVEDGYAFCTANDCSPDTDGWEIWGTLHRDERLSTAADDILSICDKYYNDDRVRRIYRNRIRYSTWMVDGQEIDYEVLMQNARDRRLSPDPRDSVRRRWGLD